VQSCRLADFKNGWQNQKTEKENNGKRGASKK
jgi:hypothetical protein